MGKKSDTIQVKIRMPKALHRKLVQRVASTPAQTINAEIVMRLERSFRDDLALPELIAELREIVRLRREGVTIKSEADRERALRLIDTALEGETIEIVVPEKKDSDK